MNLALRFPKPTLSVRTAMVARIARAVRFQLNESAALELARSPAPPALIENAIRSAKHVRGSASDAREILDASLRALSRRRVPTEDAPIPLWPGESEKAIAAAFEEAADLRAFVVLDEADSLLRDRRAAQQSWEVTQVNEMLTRMERHPCPFACTTNAPDLLDAAAARRFLFKVRFLPMTAEQIAQAYRRAFGAEPPTFVLRLDGLTPADFAIVARKASVLGERDPRALAGSRGTGEAQCWPAKDWLLMAASQAPAASTSKLFMP